MNCVYLIGVNPLRNRFNLDLKTGPVLQPSDDISMHLSVRPNEHAIVRNTLVHQGWGAEERHGGCPIAYGQQFEILILAESDQFKVWFMIFNRFCFCFGIC